MLRCFLLLNILDTIEPYTYVNLMGKIRKLISRYWAVTLFPTVVVTAIYADWNHTRKWKKSLAAQGEI
ncbi:uncharacterized protein LOC143342464 [Colletes latitarsis]|uniref:uncharacterized protein LOC143342464 n=1 Tax=Colletes latitarsis TaxID=2605962 RepID=UPI00403703DB